MANVYPTLINQFYFKHQTVLSAKIDKQDEEDQTIDESEM